MVGDLARMETIPNRWQEGFLPSFRAAMSTVNRWLDTPIGRYSLLVATAFAYLLAYLAHPALPGTDPAHPLGWWGWADQGLYLRSASALANLSVPPDTYVYPLGYSACGALFYKLTAQHVFLVPDLLFAVGTVYFFYRIAIKLVSPLEAVLLIVGFAIAYRGAVSNTFVEPWNTIPTRFFAYALIFLIGFGQERNRQIFAAAVCVALAYLCRTGDALCLLPPLGLAVLRLTGWKRKISIALVTFCILAVVVGLVVVINQSVFGSWQTPYEKTVKEFGFGTYSLSRKFFMLWVDGTPMFRERDSALVRHFPWLLLIIPGAVHLLREYKASALGVGMSIAATYTLHAGYNGALWPYVIYRYHLIHYIFWTFPLLALVTYVGLKEAWKYRLGRWSFLSVPVLLLGISCVTLRQRQTSESFPAPADQLTIPASRHNPLDWLEFIEARTAPKLFAQGRALFPPRDYLVLGHPNGIAVMLSKRAGSKPIIVETKGSEEFRHLRAGTLDWQLQLIPRWVTPLVANRFANPTVSVLGKTSNVDIAGPLGTPDGHPDEVIQVTLKPWLQSRIDTWEIETEYQSRHWISTSNPQGWWVIKTEVNASQTIEAGDPQIRLCFPDFGDFERAPTFKIRATDADGYLVWEQTIPKSH